MADRRPLLALAACTAAGCTASDRPPVTLDCAHAIDVVEVPPDGYLPVLDAVALDGTGEPVGAAASGEGDLAWFAKTGLLVARGVASEIRVPEAARGDHAIGWGNGGGRTWALTVPACEGEGAWLAFAGGHSVREPGCHTVLVRADGVEAEVRVGVGGPCAPS